jgi:hypothetical protein
LACLNSARRLAVTTKTAPKPPTIRNQEEIFNSSKRAPAISLRINPKATENISTTGIFFRIAVYKYVFIKYRTTTNAKVQRRRDRRPVRISKSITDNQITFLGLMLPDANGLRLFLGCFLSISRSFKSLNKYPILEAILNAIKPKPKVNRSGKEWIPAAKGAKKSNRFLAHCLGLSDRE